MPPTKDPRLQATQQFNAIWASIRQIEANQQQMANHINKWVAKLQGIDTVAFAALILHEGKEFKLTPETAATSHQIIQDVIAEMGRYRDEAAAAAAAKKEEEDKKPKPIKGLVVPRTPKNGKLFVPKKAKKEAKPDGTTDTDKTK